MAEEELKQTEQTNVPSDEADGGSYADALLKQQEIIKSLQDENKSLKKDNKQLVSSILNGGEYSAELSKPKKSLKEIEDDLFDLNKLKSGKITNLEFMEKALAYREALLEETGEDCFQNEYDPIGSGEKVANFHENQIQNAAESPNAYMRGLELDMNDTIIPNLNKSQKRR